MKIKAGAILSSIRIDRTSDRKISVQLYMGLRDIILSGGLNGGERLPATRTLASEVGVSRTTALDAVDRLVSEGLLESRIGAGTFVSHTLKDRVPSSARTAGPTPLQPLRLSPSAVQANRLFADRRRLPHKSQAFVTALASAQCVSHGAMGAALGAASQVGPRRGHGLWQPLWPAASSRSHRISPQCQPRHSVRS
jgi:GntR family transcriptional regulator/MocR family aminotransferase